MNVTLERLDIIYTAIVRAEAALREQGHAYHLMVCGLGAMTSRRYRWRLAQAQNEVEELHRMWLEMRSELAPDDLLGESTCSACKRAWRIGMPRRRPASMTCRSNRAEQP